MKKQPETRHMTQRMRRMLEALPNQHGPEGQMISALVGLKFAEPDGDKHKGMQRFVITARGRNALDRETRGVDPFLVMTGELA